MEELDNISIGAYYQLEDVADYDPLFKYIAPKSCFKGVSIEFNELSYGKVESLKKLAQKLSLANICSMYELLFEVDQESFLSGGVVEFAETMRYITQGLEGILKLEQKLKSSGDNEAQTRWKMAGGDNLSQLGILSTTIPLAKEFGVSPTEIAEWKWLDVFSVLLYDSMKAVVDRNLQSQK